MIRRWPLLALAGLALAGCGGSRGTTGTRTAGTTTAAAAAAATTSCHAAAEAKAMKRLNADLAALRAAAGVPAKNTLLGGPAANHATDRFLHDLQLAPIDNLARNRLIDHAIAAVIGSCQQCFQAFEAERPIPSMAYEGTASVCGKLP